MLEEAKLDDLFDLVAFLAGQEIHILMQARAVIDDREKLAKELERANIVRMMRRRYEQEFVGVTGKEERERTHIGEEGCDLKHCFLAFCYNAECAQKDARALAEAKTEEEKNKAIESAITHLKGMGIFKNMAFNIRDKLREELLEVEHEG